MQYTRFNLLKSLTALFTLSTLLMAGYAMSSTQGSLPENSSPQNTSVSKAPSQTRLPQYYAYGANLKVDGNQPFYRLTLSDEVYTQTAWPDLHDVQVFNRLGQPVPMAFQPVIYKQQTITPVPLQMFLMHSKKEFDSSTSTYINVITNGEITVKVNNLNKQPVNVTYLLQLPSDSSLSKKGKLRFKLYWSNAGYNWQAKVNIHQSHDLRSWDEIARNEPIMDLHSGSDHLLLNDIYTTQGTRDSDAWLLDITAEPDVVIPALERVELIYEENTATQEMVGIDFTLQSATPNEAIYILPTPQPLSLLQIKLQQANTVMPMQVSYMTAAAIQPNWLPLNKLIIYQLNEDATAMELRGDTLVSMIRLQAINNSWNNAPPILQGQRKKMDIIFNSGNNGPFILAWGSKKAQYTALDVNALLPAEMRLKAFINDLPIATIAEPITLSGEKMLTVEAAPTKESPYKWLLWAGLILGVIGLAIIAYKLTRELFASDNQEPLV